MSHPCTTDMGCPGQFCVCHLALIAARTGLDFYKPFDRHEILRRFAASEIARLTSTEQRLPQS